MSNKELFQWFRQLSMETIFDATEALKNKENIKKYKSSNFYKSTKLSIKKAYQMYLVNPLFTIINLINSPIINELIQGNYGYILATVEEMIENFDVNKLDNIIDYLTTKLTEIDFEDLNTKLNGAIKELNLNKIKLK